MLEFTLKRGKSSKLSTMGELYLNGTFMCYTLEDVERATKIYGATAIPKGAYKGIVNVSARFKRMMPLLLNVPGFEGVRIHAGNTAKDTHGCILVGLAKGEDMVLQSRMAYEKLMEAIGTNEFTINII